MPKYYCDYCDTYLTHDSPSVRKTHNGGRKHKENVRIYYTKWMEDQAQSLIDQTTAQMKMPGPGGMLLRGNPMIPVAMVRGMNPAMGMMRGPMLRGMGPRGPMLRGPPMGMRLRGPPPGMFRGQMNLMRGPM